MRAGGVGVLCLGIGGFGGGEFFEFLVRGGFWGPDLCARGRGMRGIGGRAGSLAARRHRSGERCHHGGVPPRGVPSRRGDSERRGEGARLWRGGEIVRRAVGGFGGLEGDRAVLVAAGLCDWLWGVWRVPGGVPGAAEC